MFESFTTILWDFDGVILDSVPFRDAGYWHVLHEFTEEKVQKLIEFQQINGGLSRYVKFRYFFNEILGREITDEKVNELAGKYSEFMLEHLLDEHLIIDDTFEFIKNNYDVYNMHIVSGSDQKELRTICDRLHLSQYFHSIHGSPTPKTDLVAQLLEEHKYKTDRTVLIGDSINDRDAAIQNSIHFYGYNNPSLQNKSGYYIKSFGEVV